MSVRLLPPGVALASAGNPLSREANEVSITALSRATRNDKVENDETDHEERYQFVIHHDHEDPVRLGHKTNARTRIGPNMAAGKSME